MVIKVSWLNNNIYNRTAINSANIQLQNNLSFKATKDKNNVSKPDNFLIDNSVYVNPKIAKTYTKIGMENLPNGLKMYRYKLSNGYHVSIVPIEGSPSVVKTYVNVGSMNETPDIKGISHFLEHMAFNGTNGENEHIKLNSGDSFKKIEELGGWANASTNYAITDYVNSVPLLNKNDVERQIKVLAAMSEDLKLSQEMINKEKGPVSSEINMILDSPQTIAMDQTVRTLFNIHSPADELVGGSVKHIQNLTRKNVLDYYNKYYTPDNTNIVITGDVNPDEIINMVSANFTSNKKSIGRKYEELLAPIQKTIRKDYVSDKATSAEIMLGFTGPKNSDAKEKILYSIAANYLSSNASNLTKNLKELNADYSINSDKISTNPNSPRIVVLEVDSSEENSEKVLHTLYDTINSLKPINDDELNIIKELLVQSRENAFEYSSNVNDAVGHAVIDNNLDYLTKYEDILNNITTEDVNTAISKYFNLNKAAITVVHPKIKNSTENPSFKGNNSRTPINIDDIEKIKLENNFDLGLYKTKSNNFVANISLNTDIPYNKKPAVREVLNEIYQMGTLDKTEDELYDYLEKNNISLINSADSNGIKISVEAGHTKSQKALDIAKELLYRPRINEENLEKAKFRVKDKLSRIEASAWGLYTDSKAQTDPYAFTIEEKIASVDSITIDDVKDFYNYVQNNSRGIVTANVHRENAQEEKVQLIDFTKSLNSVRENNVKILDLYKNQEISKILMSSKNTNQADISQIYTFKTNDSIKDNVTAFLMRSILSNSSIGLFDNLREKQNLAYSVFAELTRDQNIGELSLNILTTTDNKDTGEQSFDNIQKSINGFNNQINELLAGNFTEDDLENAKRTFKAMLLNNEGSAAKVDSINSGLNSIYGIEKDNIAYKIVDEISKEDIINLAKEVFKGKPIYSIVASKETIEANKEFLDNLTV